MSSVEITEEPDGEQFKELLQELQARNPHENRGALEQCAEAGRFAPRPLRAPPRLAIRRGDQDTSVRLSFS